MLFSEHNKANEAQNLNLQINGKNVDQIGNSCKEKYFKFVGHVLDENLTWEGHIGQIAKNLQVPTLP